MATLRLMKNRPTWHANIRNAEGKQTTVNLHIPVKGTPPASLRDKSKSIAFEKSRGKAEQALAELVANLKDERAGIRAQENIARLKQGKKEKEPKLSEAPALARSLSGGSAGQSRDVESRARQFSDFMIKHLGKDIPIVKVKDVQIQAFYNSLKDSKSTFNRRNIELRRLFRECTPTGVKTPFDVKEQSKALKPPKSAIEDKEQHRTPFSPDEMALIYETAKGTPIYGPLVIAACCGLRKGDACCLKWESVDMTEKNESITITPRKTAKHGKEVTIPLPPRAVKFLENRLPVGEYVFPEIAAEYLSGKTGEERLSKALRKVLSVALLTEDEPEAEPLKKVAPAVAYVACIEYIDTITTTEKRKARFRDVARLYLLEGKSYNQIQDIKAASKAQTSEALRDMEAATGFQLRRNPQNGKTAHLRELTTTKTKGRRFRQSVYDWHSFRVTWITEALNAGWSIADVQKVTGHSEVKTVLENYHKPDLKHLKSLPIPATSAI